MSNLKESNHHAKTFRGPVIGNGFRSSDMREKAKKGIGGLIKGFFGAK
jgi:hypothetical protein